MTKDLFRCLLALVAVAVLASCTPESPADSSVLHCLERLRELLEPGGGCRD